MLKKTREVRSVQYVGHEETVVRFPMSLKLWDRFLQICRYKGKTPALVLQGLIAQYVEKWYKENMKDEVL